MKPAIQDARRSFYHRIHVIGLSILLRSHQKTMMFVRASTAYGVAEGTEIVYFICLDLVRTFESKSLRLLFAGANQRSYCFYYTAWSIYI